MASTEGWSLSLSYTEGAASEVDLGTLVTTYSGVVFRVAYSVLRSRPDAEDTVQEVFVRLLQHRHSLAGIRDKRVWLVRIAWNLALDRKRRLRPQQLDADFLKTLIATTMAADAVLANAQRLQSVLLQMDKLPRIERNVLLLSAVDELETAEIAAVLGRSESAIRALLSRARSRLRERLENEGGKP